MEDSGDVDTAGSTSHAWWPETIRDLLTADRLRSYLRSCDQDLDRALALYEWNLTASAAVIQTAAIVEVVVRNALDAQLLAWASRRSRESWLDVIPLDARGQADIEQARDRATNHGRTTLTHGKVVAELSFGCWRYLTAQRYHASLWVPALHDAFPGGDEDLRRRRREVEHHLANLMLVRNRAAHHEPIHRRDLDRGQVRYPLSDDGQARSSREVCPATINPLTSFTRRCIPIGASDLANLCGVGARLHPQGGVTVGAEARFCEGISPGTRPDGRASSVFPRYFPRVQTPSH